MYTFVKKKKKNAQRKVARKSYIFLIPQFRLSNKTVFLRSLSMYRTINRVY